MGLNEWITVGALLLGPIMAVLITLGHEKRKEGRRAKLDIFYTLVAHKYQYPIPRDLVSCLNKIDVVFYGQEAVTNSRRKYFSSLSQIPFDSLDSNNFFADLLNDMARNLGYTNLKPTVYSQSYSPQQFQIEESRKSDIHRELMRVLQNSHSFGGYQPQVVDHS